MSEKIAIFRALYLGDMLLAVPALRAIREHFPHAEITLIGLPWAAWFCQRYSKYLDRFVAFPGYPGLQEAEGHPERIQAFIAEQRNYHYDLVVQMHGSGQVSNLFACELGGETTVGYFPGEQREASAGLSLRAPYPEDQHEIYRNLGLASMLGCTRLDPGLEFPLQESDFAEIKQVLAPFACTDGPWIGLHVGAKHPSRRWPPAYFAQLADALAHDSHTQVVFTGGTYERSTVQSIIRDVRGRAINLAGRTSLGGLAALLSRLDLFISNDTGPAHLAYAVDTPSITLFGPTDYRRWQPLDRHRHLIVRTPVACSPCAYQTCPIDHRCMARIHPSSVRELAIKTLQASQRGNERGANAKLASQYSQNHLNPMTTS